MIYTKTPSLSKPNACISTEPLKHRLKTPLILIDVQFFPRRVSMLAAGNRFTAQAGS